MIYLWFKYMQFNETVFWFITFDIIFVIFRSSQRFFHCFAVLMFSIAIILIIHLPTLQVNFAVYQVLPSLSPSVRRWCCVRPVQLIKSGRIGIMPISVGRRMCCQPTVTSSKYFYSLRTVITSAQRHSWTFKKIRVSLIIRRNLFWHNTYYEFIININKFKSPSPPPLPLPHVSNYTFIDSINLFVASRSFRPLTT